MPDLAIIPARGGSKRIPRKNIRDFFGKPVIAHAIETAVNSRLFHEVMVSTDDEEIAGVARSYGAKVPFFRTKALAGEHAPLADVVDEVRDRYLEAGQEFRFICCLLPTAVLATADLLKKGLGVLEAGGADSVRPVVRFSYPVQRAMRLTGDKMEFLNPEHRYTRSQDLEPAYHDAGMFYWMKAGTGLRGDKRAAFEIPEINSQDIDDETDWKMAELKFKLLRP